LTDVSEWIRIDTFTEFPNLGYTCANVKRKNVVQNKEKSRVALVKDGSGLEPLPLPVVGLSAADANIFP
jgi:hypothetical protein